MKGAIMASLLDKVEAQEQSQKNTTVKKKSASLTIANNSDGSKDKQISAKVNDRVYGLFTQINKAQGISNNSALNMLISRYVRENKGILDEERGCRTK